MSDLEITPLAGTSFVLISPAVFALNLIGVSIGARTATISSISSDVITLTTSAAFNWWESSMDGNVYISIYNTTKSQLAWVKASPAVNQLTVTAASDISTWASTDTVSTSFDGSSTYGEIDVSPVVPAGATSVYLPTLASSDTGTIVTNRGLYLSGGGGGEAITVRVQVSGIQQSASAIISLDSDRMFQWWDRATGSNTMSNVVQIGGYFI